MLVNRKQQNDAYQQYEAPPVIKRLPKLDTTLRAKCLVTVILVVVIAIFATVRSEAIIRTGYDLVQVKSKALSMQRENELLRLDIARLKSPQRIQSIATAELGMVVPQKVYRAENIPKTIQSNTEKEKNLFSQVVSSVMPNKGL